MAKYLVIRSGVKNNNAWTKCAKIDDSAEHTTERMATVAKGNTILSAALEEGSIVEGHLTRNPPRTVVNDKGEEQTYREYFTLRLVD